MPVPIWSAFTPRERRNMAFYIAGIMLYKLGLESFNGSIVTLATDRFGGGSTFGKLGILTGINQAMQVVGSIAIAPLMKRFPTRSVLSSAIIVFGCIVTLFLIIDAATGGKIKATTSNGKVKYGTWAPDALFPLYAISGIAYGMVELIRRVIPRDIVGGDVSKLRKMDAVVHILYEVAGTSGSLLSVALIKKLGNNYSFIITPPLFILAAIAWRMVDGLGHQTAGQQRAAAGGLKEVEFKQESYAHGLLTGFKAFGRATYKGAFICFTSRKFVWLPFAYSLALYGHRYLENGIAPAIAKRVMMDSSYSQIMVTGSNAGELLGAMIVLVLGSRIPTPMPFLRFDALALLIVWVLPSYISQIVPNQSVWAWKIAGMFVPVSIGWASGDVSLAAFIQASLARIESEDSEVSALGAVMSFLYSTYIIVYAVAGSLLGKYVDAQYKKDKNLKTVLTNIAGVHFTVLAAVIIISTFVPKGAFSFNPQLINDTDVSGELDAVSGVPVDTLKKRNSANGSEDEDEYEKPVKTTDIGATF